MPSARIAFTAATATCFHASTVSAWAYALGSIKNQAISYDGGSGGGATVVVGDSSGVQCFTDAPNTCGNCGVSFKDPKLSIVSSDITSPGVYENDACGNPCVTYNSNGMSFDDIQKAAVDTPAGSLTVAKTGQSMACKVLQSSNCGGIGPVGANYVNMYVVCDPGIVGPPAPGETALQPATLLTPVAPPPADTSTSVPVDTSTAGPVDTSTAPASASSAASTA